MRGARIERETGETKIVLSLELDGTGRASVDTGIGFFDHMLCALARHALIDIELTCKGDLHVDSHHTVEDCGIALGDALKGAVGDRSGIARIASSCVPMDEALAFCALDLSNRGHLAYQAPPAQGMIGTYDAQMTKEFFRAVAVRGGITLHMRLEGENDHHIAEAAYKAFGRALRAAAERDNRVEGIPSTKGVL